MCEISKKEMVRDTTISLTLCQASSSAHLLPSCSPVQIYFLTNIRLVYHLNYPLIMANFIHLGPANRSHVFRWRCAPQSSPSIKATSFRLLFSLRNGRYVELM